MSESCIKENELGKITAILDRIESDIYGNGKEGIFNSIPRIEGKINDLSGSVISHTRVISNFIEFQAKYNSEEKGKKEQEEREKIAKELETTKKRDKTQKIFLFVMAGLVLLGLIINAYFGFKNSKVPIKESIDNMDGISKVTREGYIKYNDNGLSDSIKIK
jgi:hypothetical protein